MAKKKNKLQKKFFTKPWLIIAGAALIISIGSITALRVWYYNNLGPVSSVTATSYFTVESGSSLPTIASNLQKAGLVRSSGTFVTYVKGNEEGDKLQAGTYVLSPSLSVQQIVKKMTNGDVAKNLLTILPGKRLDQIKAAFAEAGYSQADISYAFNPSLYASKPALANLPRGASLEGFLYPDSFQKQADTPASTIISESLDEMQQKLTTDVVNGFAAHGLSVYQGVTLASIVYQETDDSASEPTVAQVFYSRLANGMALESNVTANYAADIAGVARTTNINSPYNTYLHTGLPPGPIGNVSAAVLKAVAHPSSTDYLYFIAGDDGTIHFSQTEAQHEQAIQQYCQTKCG